MEINLGEYWLYTDNVQYILEEKDINTTERILDNLGFPVKTYKRRRFFSTIHGAFNFMLKQEIFKSKAADIKELQKDLHRIQEYITKQVEIVEEVIYEMG